MRVKVLDTELYIDRITQLCGQNVIKKTEILYALKKYFSNEKYQEYEEKLRADICVDGSPVGRNYFTVYSFASRNDLYSEIKLLKTSLMMKYLRNKLSNYSEQLYIEKLDEILIKLFGEINDGIRADLGDIQLEYEVSELLDIIQKTSVLCGDGNRIEAKSTYELICIWLKLIRKNLEITPEKTLIIMNDIDHLITNEEYALMISQVRDIIGEFDVFLITGVSLDKYPVVTKEVMCGITVINDEIFECPGIDFFADFIEKYYPYNKPLSQEEILDILGKIVQKIGGYNALLEIQEEVVLKMLNHTLMINEGRKYKGVGAETSFLFADKML